MTSEEENKLTDILARRYKELAFNSPNETWREYLERNGMRRYDSWKESVSAKETTCSRVEIMPDPSPFGGLIIIPKEVATRILVLGLP